MKKRCILRYISLVLCVSVSFLSMQIYAANLTEENLRLGNIDDEFETHRSFIIEYNPHYKNDLIEKIAEIEGVMEEELDFINCISVTLNMDQLASIKEMDYIKYIERNYDYTLLTNKKNFHDEESAEALKELLVGKPQNTFTKNNNSVVIHENKFKNVQDKYTHPQNANLFIHETLYGSAHSRNVRGQRIKVAILDTGINEHQGLNISGGVSFVDCKVSFNDSHGHGTQMAGIISASGLNNQQIKGGAPLAEVYAVKVVPDNGFATTVSIILGIEWAMHNDINIVNMSFGTYFYSRLLKDALKRAHDSGIILVGAVGNDGSFEDEDRIMYPAAYDTVIAAGAGSTCSVSSFSNNNEMLDFVAPGRLDTTDVDNKYTHIAGTSVSAAYITGVLACLWSNKPKLYSDNLLNIAKNASQVSSEQSNYVGYGLLDLDKAIKFYDEFSKSSIDKRDKNNKERYDSSKIHNSSQMNIDDNLILLTGYGDSMENAIPINFLNWNSGRIDSPYQDKWYTFVANASGVHPNGSKGFYSVSTHDTYTNFDTVVHVYDSDGVEVDVNDDYGTSLKSYLVVELQRNQRYYVRVRGWGTATGNYNVRVGYTTDDYGNCMNSAHNIIGIYYNDQTFNGNIHGFISENFGHTDRDFFVFVPARDSVLELYTEGTTNTYGTLYNSNGNIIADDSSSGGNGNFKIRIRLRAYQWYYLEVRHNTPGSYGNYTLRTKFIRDYNSNVINEQYRVVYWVNDDENIYPWVDNCLYKVFVSYHARSEFKDRVVRDLYNTKTGLASRLASGVLSEVYNYLISFVLSFVPYGEAIKTGAGILMNMQVGNVSSYEQRQIDVQNGIGDFIVGRSSTVVVHDGGIDTVWWETGSTRYNGPDYSRGIFVETRISP